MSGVPPGAKPLGNGFYEYGGEMHVDLEELVIASGGDPTSEQDLMTAMKAIEQGVAQDGIPMEVRQKP